MLFCQCLALVFVPSLYADEPTLESTNSRSNFISHYCENLQQSLKTLQHKDSRIRVYLGSHFETLLNKFITPLNLRLIKNNHPAPDLAKNQSTIAAAKTNFSDDFIIYQKSLETLISTDCKSNPEGFYQQLLVTREKRQTVSFDVFELKKLVARHIELVTALKGSL